MRNVSSVIHNSCKSNLPSRSAVRIQQEIYPSRMQVGMLHPILPFSSYASQHEYSEAFHGHKRAYTSVRINNFHVRVQQNNRANKKKNGTQNRITCGHAPISRLLSNRARSIICLHEKPHWKVSKDLLQMRKTGRSTSLSYWCTINAVRFQRRFVISQ